MKNKIIAALIVLFFINLVVVEETQAITRLMSLKKTLKESLLLNEKDQFYYLTVNDKTRPYSFDEEKEAFISYNGRREFKIIFDYENNSAQIYYRNKPGRVTTEAEFSPEFDTVECSFKYRANGLLGLILRLSEEGQGKIIYERNLEKWVFSCSPEEIKDKLEELKDVIPSDIQEQINSGEIVIPNVISMTFIYHPTGELRQIIYPNFEPSKASS